ncbi:MAG TPA: hypothetical protein VHE53_03245 [Patescibacteria group bacterium]|nr:hypothetical protein [Patescibacteria group bacterium]
MDNNNQPQDQNKLVIPPEVRTYLEGILKDANMTEMDETMREEMINELFARLDSYMTTVIIDNMPAENIDEFIRLNEEKKPREEIENYLKEKMPNAQDVLTKAFMDFRDMYLSNVTVARNIPASDATTGEMKGGNE